MKKFILTIIFFILSSNVFSANEELKNKIYKNIRCIVCQGQSIYESNSDFAIDLKKLISKKLDNGENEKQIYDFLISRYGDWIVYNPGLNFNSLARSSFSSPLVSHMQKSFNKVKFFLLSIHADT